MQSSDHLQFIWCLKTKFGLEALNLNSRGGARSLKKKEIPNTLGHHFILMSDFNAE